MAELDTEVLQEQLEAVAKKILSLKRKPDRGYQGALTFEDAIVVVKCRDGMGTAWYIDPDEIADGDPDVFAREYVRIGRERKGVSVLQLLERFLPLVSPQAAGTLAWLRRLLGQ